MTYTPQAWVDLSATAESEAARLNHIEAGIKTEAPSYSQQVWADLPATGTARAALLNHIEAGIDANSGSYIPQAWTDLAATAAGSRAARRNYIEAGVSTISPAPVSDLEAFIDYTTKVDGVHPATMDTGQAVVLTYSPSEASPGPSISGGRMDTTDVTTGASAGYATVHLASKIAYMECDFNFSASGSTWASQAGLIAWSRAMPNGNLSQISTQYSVCHLVIRENNWEYGVFPPGGGLQVLATHSYGFTINDTRTVHVEVILDQDVGQAWVTGPDGVQVHVQHSLIASIEDCLYLCAEPYYTYANTDHRIKFQNFGGRGASYVAARTGTVGSTLPKVAAAFTNAAPQGTVAPTLKKVSAALQGGPATLVDTYACFQTIAYDGSGTTRNISTDGWTNRCYSTGFFNVSSAGIWPSNTTFRAHNSCYHPTPPSDLTRMWGQHKLVNDLPSQGGGGNSVTFHQSASNNRAIFCQLYGTNQWQIAYGVTATSNGSFDTVLASGTLGSIHALGDIVHAIWDQASGLVKMWRIRAGVATLCGSGTYSVGDEADYNRVGIGSSTINAFDADNFRAGSWIEV